MPTQAIKPWYVSKTLWTNIMAVIGIIIQTQTGFIFPVELQGALLAIINFILRLITKSEIEWSKDDYL